MTNHGKSALEMVAVGLSAVFSVLLLFSSGSGAAEEWEPILKVGIVAEHSQTRHDALKQVDSSSKKGLKELFRILGLRDPYRIDWFVREGAWESLLEAQGEEAEAEFDKVLKGRGKDSAKEAILYSFISKLRKAVVEEYKDDGRFGENEDRRLSAVKYHLRKSRGTEYFELVLPVIKKLDPDKKNLKRMQALLKDKSTRVRRAAITGLTWYPDAGSILLLINHLKKNEKNKKKVYREWVLNLHALEVLTGQSFRDSEDWLRWWDIVKAQFSLEQRIEDEKEKKKVTGKTAVVQGGVEVTVNLKVVGDGYPLFVLPWRGYEVDYFRPYFHGIEEFCKVYYVRMPQLGDFKGLKRDLKSNVVTYPTQILSDALTQIIKDTKLEKFAVLAHGPYAAHLGYLLCRGNPKKVTQLVLINPWSDGEKFRDTVKGIERTGKQQKNEEVVKGAKSRFIGQDGKPLYIAADSAEAGGMGRALFNMHFARPDEPEVSMLQYLYPLSGGSNVMVDSNWRVRTLAKKYASTVPVLIFHGAKSYWLPPGEIERVASVFKKKEVAKMPNSGEFPFMAETYLFTQRMKNFFRRTLPKKKKAKSSGSSRTKAKKKKAP